MLCLRFGRIGVAVERNAEGERNLTAPQKASFQAIEFQTDYLKDLRPYLLCWSSLIGQFDGSNELNPPHFCACKWKSR